MKKAAAGKTIHNVRRLWPIVLMGWERWQQLPPERKEAYKRQAKGYAERGRKAIEQRRPKRGR